MHHSTDICVNTLNIYPYLHAHWAPSTPQCSAGVENDGGTTTESSVTTLLQYLKSPTPPNCQGKEQFTVTHLLKGKKRSQGQSANDPKSVTPQQWVKEHNGECLCMSNKRLFCKAYREEPSLVSSSINNHIKSAKHREGKKRLESKEKRETDIAAALKISDSSNPVGQTLPQDQCIYCVKVVTAFLRAGVPLNKLECF